MNVCCKYILLVQYSAGPLPFQVLTTLLDKYSTCGILEEIQDTIIWTSNPKKIIFRWACICQNRTGGPTTEIILYLISFPDIITIHFPDIGQRSLLQIWYLKPKMTVTGGPGICAGGAAEQPGGAGGRGHNRRHGRGRVQRPAVQGRPAQAGTIYFSVFRYDDSSTV